MTGDLAGVAVLPQSVRWSARSWLIAVAAGGLEAVIHTLTNEGYNAAVELRVRAVVYVLVIVFVVQLLRGRAWARIALTVVLGGLGMFSLLAEPVSWLMSGGSPGAFLAAADVPTVVVVVIRAVHVVAVIVALVLMYRPAANSYFSSGALTEKANLR